MRRLALAVLFLVSSCAHTAAVAPAPAPRSPQPAEPAAWVEVPAALAGDPRDVEVPELAFDVVQPEIRTLKNGIPVYLLPDHTVPLVTVRTQVFAGGVDEPADKLGLSDVAFELMPTGGAGKMSPEALDELLEFHAANLGAGAGSELSGVGINLRSEDLDRLLPVYADVVLRPKFEARRFEIAISRRLEGVHRRPDNPAGLASRALAKAVFGREAPFGREASADSLRRIRLEDVRAFHRRAVVPANMRILATGDFDPDRLIAQLEALFGQLPRGERITRTWTASPALQRRVIYVPRRDLAQAKIRIGARGFDRHDDIEHAARVMNDALGGGLGAGRLFREIRDRQGLAYSAYSVVSPGPSGGIFYAGADTRPDAVGRSIESILSLLEDTRARGFGNDELSHATQRFLNSFVFRFDAPARIVGERAEYDALGYPEDYLKTYRERVSAVGVDRAKSAAERLLEPAAWQIVVVGPEGLEDELSRFGPVTIIDDVDRFEPRR